MTWDSLGHYKYTGELKKKKAAYVPSREKQLPGFLFL